jgi:hypothetical protein
MAVSGNYAYVAGQRWTGSNYVGSFEVINVSNPANPQQVGGYDTSGNASRVAASRVAVAGNYAYVAETAWFCGFPGCIRVGAGLLVIDISNPANPQGVGGYDTSGSAPGVAVSGNYAYVTETTGQCSPLGGCTPPDGQLHVIDVSNPTNLQRVGGYDNSVSAQGVAVSGNYAYVAARSAGLQVIDISNPANPQRLGSRGIGGGTAQAVAVSGNYAYVAAGSAGLQVIDVSNPANPQRAGGYDTSGSAQGVAVSGNYAYVADDVAGLQVIDVSNPANPQRVGGYDTGGYAQVVGVAVSGNYAYVAEIGRWTGSNYVGGGLEVIDISNPANPQRVGGYDTNGIAWGVAVSGNYAYVVNGDAGLQVIDVSNPANPQRAGGYDTIGSAQDVVVSGTYAYVRNAASGPGEYFGLEVIEVSNPANPKRVGRYLTLSLGIAITPAAGHLPGVSETDVHAQGLVISGKYAYVADGGAGLQVIDVSIANPQRMGGYDISGSAQGVAVSGNYAYVADGTNGLQVIDVSNPANPQRVGGYDTGGYALVGVAVSGNYAYVAEIGRWTGSNYVGGGLEAIDISSPANPRRVGGYDTSGYALRVAVSGNYAYVASSVRYDGTNRVGGGLEVIDVTNPANPQRVGGYDTTRFAWGVAVSGNYAYVMAKWDGLQVIDVSNPANPRRVGGYPTASYAQDVAVSGSYAYVADRDAGLQVIDVSNPANPQRAGGYYDSRADAVGVAVSGNYAYVGNVASRFSLGLQVIDVSDPRQPRLVGGNSAFDAFNVTVAGNKVFVTAGVEGLMILDLFRAPLRLEPVSPQQPGAFRFLLHGEAGLSVRVQRSSNLRDWEDWQSVTFSATPAELTDPNAGAVPHRYYRAVYP